MSMAAVTIGPAAPAAAVPNEVVTLAVVTGRPDPTGVDLVAVV